MKAIITIRHSAIAAALVWLPSALGAPPQKWEASIPKVAQDGGSWTLLTENLLRNSMYYGSLASARRATTYFTDLPSKEAAYRSIIGLVERGFPLSVQDAFITADLQPDAASNPEFANNYYLYKALLSKEKKIDRWAQYYFAKIDRENFPKFLFFTALEAYSKGDLNTAAETLRTFLSKDIGDNQLPLHIKATRTLARIYFEQTDYERSLEIYQSFLLKLNPISPNDWLEAAWNLFHLKRYSEALGMLYNLESKASGNEIELEKYSIRALIYRQLCSQSSMDALVENFNRNFGKLVDGIKHGEPLINYPVLKMVRLPENTAYNQALISVANLTAEQARISDLPKSEQPLANYLYKTEIQMLSLKIKGPTTAALTRVAEQLLMISEQLRFLKFDIERSKFNPESVFKREVDPIAAKIVHEDPASNSFSVIWPQIGDYWIDERNSYRASVVNRCFE